MNEKYHSMGQRKKSSYSEENSIWRFNLGVTSQTEKEEQKETSLEIMFSKFI